MSDKYEIKEYDSPKRFLVVKNKEVAYLVEMDHFGKDRHRCSCIYFETKKFEDLKTLPPCKHIRMVHDHLYQLTLFK